MSFTTLLAASRSIANIKDRPSRYKMTQANLLPRFGQLTPGEGDINEAGLTHTRQALDVFGSQSAAPAAASPSPVACSPASRPRGGWLKNPFARKSKTGAETGPVQSEFPLDGVKVIRNDLTDADLEVVPARPAPTPVTPRPTEVLASRPAKLRLLVRRWVARWSGAPRG